MYLWYLSGWNLYLSGNDNKPAAKANLQKSLSVSHENQMHHDSRYFKGYIIPFQLSDEKTSDSEIFKHVKELLEQLKDIEVPAEEEVVDLDDLSENGEDMEVS